jgi:hypothetical protein
MARLTKKEEVQRYCANLKIYCYILEFDLFTVNCSVLAETQELAEKAVSREYTGYKTKKLSFISNRIQVT